MLASKCAFLGFPIDVDSLLVVGSISTQAASFSVRKSVLGSTSRSTTSTGRGLRPYGLLKSEHPLRKSLRTARIANTMAVFPLPIGRAMMPRSSPLTRT